MSTIQERIETVLSGHVPKVVYFSAEEGCISCHGCELKWPSFAGFYAHQAAMLAPIIREAQAEAWDKGAFDASMSLDHGGHNADNPYRSTA